MQSLSSDKFMKKYLSKNKDLYSAFADLEKAFDHVPRKTLWWAMRIFGVEEQLTRTVKTMYTNAKSSVRVNGQYSPWFDVIVGVDQGSVLSPLLFVIVMEALHVISGLVVLGNSFMHMT